MANDSSGGQDDRTFFLLHKAPFGMDAANAPSSATTTAVADKGAAEAAQPTTAEVLPPVSEAVRAVETLSPEGAPSPASAAAPRTTRQTSQTVLVPAVDRQNAVVSPVLTASVTIPKDYVPCTESTHALYQIRTDTFAGPLDLLLFLIRRHDLDIFDIPIAFICERYLEALEVLEELSLDVASEFLYMAAELLHIKSRMLLPKPEVTEEEEEGDPRAELVRRLLEYQKYQAAADALNQLDRLGRDVFARAPGALPEADRPRLREVSIFALVHAFNAVLKRQKPEVRHRVVVEQVSVKKRMTLLVDALAAAVAMPFAQLLGSARERLDVVVTFLAVLELTRLKLLRICETDGGELLLQARFDAPEQALLRLEGVDEQFAG